MINLLRLEQLSQPKVIAAKRRLHNRQRGTGKMMKSRLSSHQVDFTIGTSWRCRRDHDASYVGDSLAPVLRLYSVSSKARHGKKKLDRPTSVSQYEDAVRGTICSI